jgi:hypothetical protein
MPFSTLDDGLLDNDIFVVLLFRDENLRLSLSPTHSPISIKDANAFFF